MRRAGTVRERFRVPGSTGFLKIRRRKIRNPFAALKGDGQTSADLAADVREAEKALAEAETRAGEVENAARADALDALAGGKAVKEGAADLSAARLRVSAMQSGIDALKAKLRTRLESEHADARRAAEEELAGCATADAALAGEIAPAAVKLLQPRHAAARAEDRAGDRHADLRRAERRGASAGCDGLAIHGGRRARLRCVERHGRSGRCDRKGAHGSGQVGTSRQCRSRGGGAGDSDSHLDVDAEVARLLPAPLVEEAPLQPTPAKEAYRPAFRFETEPLAGRPDDVGLVKY